jgi:hypothetical protein
MKRLCEFYIRHAGFIGLLFYAIPTLIGFMVLLLSAPFREVYLLRMGLSLVFGSAIAAYLNRYGVELWLCKHRSNNGPATIVDGILIGAAIGLGMVLLPTLSIFIKTNHSESAKTFVIVCYLLVTFFGAIIGGILASIGRKFIDR